MGSGVIIADWPAAELESGTTSMVSEAPRWDGRTHLVICADHFISDLDLALFHLPDMQDISIVHLHVLHFELGLSVNGDHTGIVFLSTLLGIEICAVEEDTE